VTVEELTAFAQAARAHAKIPCKDMHDLVSVCPPQDGMDAFPPLEVAAGLIAAAAGLRVLIVTDRCVPPKRGLTAASVLERLGLDMTWDPSEAEDWVVKARFAVASVSGRLPGLMGLRRVRGEIGVRTPLATVEKLIAPPNAAIVIGAQQGPGLGVAVEVLQALGHPRALAVQGPEGGVIPSVRKKTRGIELADGFQVPLTVAPEDIGMNCDSDPELPMFGPPDEGYGSGDNKVLVKCCGDMTSAVLAGEVGPARNAALLGAALILKAGGRAPTVADGVSLATEALDSGEPIRILERLRSLS
jgi:anthranilate phosphoribosyltransferase